MNKILLASSNKGKLAEAREFLEKAGFGVISPAEIPGAPPIIDETGATYEANARLKAEGFFNWARIAALSDDTGLEVVGLGGGPGVQSARYAGEAASSEGNKLKLLSALQGKIGREREARFVCCLCLCAESGAERFFWGELKGRIAEAESGSGGFGYDSVFIPEGESRSLASLKAENSLYPTHRTRALEALAQYLRIL